MSSGERTLFLIKPDGVQRGLVSDIIERIEKKGLQIVGSKPMPAPRDLAKTPSEEHVGKPFFMARHTSLMNTLSIVYSKKQHNLHFCNFLGFLKLLFYL